MIASSNFLIPNATLIVEVVAFLVVLYFIGRKVLPIVNRVLEERQEQIRSALAAADEARAEADETRAQRQSMLEEARQQARQIVSAANTTAERIRSEAVERGQQEYERLVANADSEISLARQRAVDEVSSQVGALVISVAQQVIGREIDAATHRNLVNEAVTALRGSTDTSAAGPQA